MNGIKLSVNHSNLFIKNELKEVIFLIKFFHKKNLEHCNLNYNVQGINKSTPKTYLMF